MAVQINVAASQAALVNSIQAGVNAYNQRFANQNQINLSINAKAFSQPLGRITGDVKDFEAALAASNARVIAFGASTAVLGAAIKGFKELASTTIEVEKNLADINRVLGLTTGGLQKFSTDLFDVAKQTASSFNDVSKAALEFSRQGLKVEDTLQRTKDALTLARLAGMSTSAAVDSLTSSVNGFATTGITTTQVLNKLVAVEQNYAVGAGDLAEALSRTGQAAQEAGVSIDQLNALVTSAQEKTARGGAVIGNALKTIFTRLQRSETLDQLEAYNIAVRDIKGNTLPAVNILQNFAAAYKNLADSQKAQLSEQVAGVYQVNILKAIVGDLNSQQSTYSKALKDGANATNEADLATAKLNQTLSALFSQTATGTQQLANNIGKVTFEPLAREAVNTANSVLESFNEILEGEGIGSDFANGFLKGIRNLLAGPGAIAAFYTLFKLIQNSFSYLTTALPQIAGITTETQNRKNIEQSILQIMQQQGPLSQALAGHMGNEAAQAQLLLNAATARTAQMQQELALAKSLAATLSSQGVTQKGTSGLTIKSSGGYIPPSTRMAETLGAKAGGYTPGRVVNSPVGGVMNTAENVRYIPGFAQPFINPPANSRAGIQHRQNSISRTGIDPYMFGGFIPNFAISTKTKEFLNSQGFSGKLYNLPFSAENERKKIRNVADVYSFIPETKEYAEDSIVGQGIRYVVKEIGGKTSDQLKKASLALALRGTKEQILKNIPSDNSSLVNFDVWNENRKLFASQNNKNLKVKSLIDSTKEVSFSRQLTGLTNLITGQIFENRVARLANVTKKGKSNDRFDFDPSNIQEYLGGEAKSGNFNMFDLIAKAIGSKNQKYNGNKKSDDIQFDLPIELFIPEIPRLDTTNFSKGFIPNFVGEMSNAKIAAWLRMGKLTPEQAAEMGYKPSAQRIAEQRGQDFVSKIPYQVIPIPFKTFGESGATLQSAYGTEYEKHAISVLKGMGYPDVKSAVDFGIPGGGNSRADAIDPVARAFFEMKGGDITSVAELKAKFSGVRSDLIEKYRRELLTYKDILIRNPNYQRSSAGGFIPNFAYKQAVMSLESNLSGSSAVFDTKPFPHIRNSSQPTFSSAIADHGGLNNALRDSMVNQKMAGLMSYGYIPNFAGISGKNINFTSTSGGMFPGMGSVLPPDVSKKLIKSINDEIKAYEEGKIQKQELIDNTKKLIDSQNLTADVEAKLNKRIENRIKAIDKSNSQGNATQQNQQTAAQNAKKALNDKIEKATNTALFAVPIIAGQLEQFAFGNKKRTDMTATERGAQSFLSTGLTSVSTGASLGTAILGPGFGTAIGAATGALFGLAQAVGDSKLSIEELRELQEEEKDKAKKDIELANAVFNTQKILSESSNPKEIKTNFRILSESIKSIKDADFAKKVKDAGQDFSKLSDIIEEYSIKQKNAISVLDSLFLQSKISSAAGVSAAGGKLSKEGSTGFTGKLDILFGAENQLKTMDLANPTNRQLLLKNTEPLLEKLGELNTDVLMEFQKEYSAQLKGSFSFGYGSFLTGELEKILQSGGMDKKDIEQTVAILKETSSGNNIYANTLSEHLLTAVNLQKKRKEVDSNDQKTNEEKIEASIQATNNYKEYIFNLQRELSFQKEIINLQNQNRDIALDYLKFLDENMSTKTELLKIENERNKELIVRQNKDKLTSSGVEVVNKFLDFLSKAPEEARANLKEDFLNLSFEDQLSRIENAPSDLLKFQKEMSQIVPADSKSVESLYEAIRNYKKEVGEINILQQKQLRNEEEKYKYAKKRHDLEMDFTFNLKSGFRSLSDESDVMISKLGKEIPGSFRDGMTNAIMDVAKSTKSIGDAFKDMAINFGQMLMQEVIRAMIGKAMGSIFSSFSTVSTIGAGLSVTKQNGGLIRAQNGMYISGGRTGDRNLALLEDGEYVLNRNAVKAFGGPSALDQFNYRSAPRFGGGFQSGGGFDMAAQMRVKDSEASYTDNLLFGNTVAGKINADNYSAYAYENDQYFKTKRDEAIKKEQERVQKAFAKKQKNAQLISSIVGAIGSMAFAYGMQGLSGSGFGSGSGKAVVSKSKIGTRALERSLSPNGSPEMLTTSRQRGGLIGFNSGGFVPYGSRLNDTIPALLTGGEYVMNNSAVKRYGLGTLNSMNAGAYNNSTSATTNNNTHNNATNISINVDRNGKAVYGADTSSYEKQDIVLSKQMAANINQVVLTTIANEKRYGGELYKNPLRS